MERTVLNSKSDTGLNTNPAAYGYASANPGLWNTVTTIMKGVQRYLMIWNARRALQRLSDHVLKDIGISRAEIDAVSVRGRKRSENRSASSGSPLAR
jgi:uncharacterized protein YjiS (DUF1127 family)